MSATAPKIHAEEIVTSIGTSDLLGTVVFVGIVRRRSFPPRVRVALQRSDGGDRILDLPVGVVREVIALLDRAATALGE